MEITIPMAEEEVKDDKQTVWDDYTPIIRSGNQHFVYLSDDIVAPYNYSKLTHLLCTMTKKDTVNMHVNTVGGDLSTVVQLCDAMTRCQGTVVVHLSGYVASGGTFITMCADKLIVAPNTRFLIHNYSGGVSGKGNEVKAEQAFMETYVPALYRDVYKDFLTPAEINVVLDDKDMWMGTEEVLVRWGVKKEAA